MTKKQVSTNKGATTFQALEWTFFGICEDALVAFRLLVAGRLLVAAVAAAGDHRQLTGSLMSASVLASAKGTSTELAFVLLFWCN